MKALNFAIAALCCLGIWWSYKIARADNDFRKDTLDSLQSAIALVPDQPKYYTRLAQLDPDRAEPLLEKALSINRNDSMALIDLGLLRESMSDFVGAEKLLLQAFEVDHTYLPRWTLANYYLRRDDLPGFWKWARKAAEMPAENITPLLQLCWRVQPDAATIGKAILTDDPVITRQFLVFLLGKKEFRQAAAVAPRLIEHGHVDTDRPVLLSLVDQLLVQNDGGPAKSVWQLLGANRWIVSDSTLPENALFARQPLQAGFDWKLFAYDGLHSWPGPSGLEVEFSGKEPESSIVAEQVIPMEPGAYQFQYEYRTTGIAPGTGLRWRVIDAKSGDPLAASADLSHETLRQEAFTFRVTSATPLIRLRLEYQRALGTARIMGRVVVVSTKLQSESTHELSQVWQLRRSSIASGQMDGCPSGIFRTPGVSMPRLPTSLFCAE
jgi:tetratricopeptide (TPR) repeat protein